MSEGYSDITDDSPRLGLLRIILDSYHDNHLDYDGTKSGYALPLSVASGKASRNTLARDKKELCKHMYWTPGSNLITPPVICVDVDSKHAIRDTFMHIQSSGFPMKPSVIILNTHKGTAQFQWFIPRMYCHVGKTSKHSEVNDPVHTTMFREVRRSLTALLHGDGCFIHERMRNPYYHDERQRVMLLNGAPRYYELEDMKHALESVHNYITDESVAGRFNMKALIAKETRQAMCDGAEQDRPRTMEDFIPQGVVPMGSRNRTAYRAAFAAAMHHVNPNEVMKRMRFEGTFTQREKDAITKNVLKTCKRKLHAYGESTSMGEPVPKDDVFMNTYDSMHRTNHRFRKRVSATASRIASSYGRRGALNPSEKQLATRASNLARGTRSSVIRHALLRHDVIHAITMLADRAPRFATDMNLRRYVAMGHGMKTYSDRPCDYMTSSIRNTRREIQHMASAWLINHNGYNTRRIQRVLNRHGVISGTARLIAIAQSTGFMTFIERHGISIDETAMMRMNGTGTIRTVNDGTQLVANQHGDMAIMDDADSTSRQEALMDILFDDFTYYGPDQ